MSDKVDVAVKRLQEAAAMSQTLYEQPLVITYSGGKDSDTILKLAQIAKIPFEVLHNHTTADAPETVYHVRNKFRELELAGANATLTTMCKLMGRGLPCGISYQGS